MTRCIAFAILSICVLGCVVRTPENDVTAVASALRGEGEAVRKSLQWQGNIKGDGIVVFVRAEAGCEPEFTWVGLRGRIFAMDKASHDLTPDVPLLTSSDLKALPRLGWKDLDEGRQAIRQEACRNVR
jgi:hypothetical protein